MFGMGKRSKRELLAGKMPMRYVGGDSLLHRLDPRTKLIMVLAFSSTAIFINSLVSAAILFTAVITMALISRASKVWLRALAAMLPFVIIIVFFDMLFPRVSYGTLYWSADFWVFHPSVTYGGILYGVTMGLRLMTFAGIVFLFIMSTRYEDFINGLRKLMLPPTFAFSLGLALRSATYLSADMRNVMDAQRSRCLELDKGGFKKMIDNLLSLFIPMTVNLLNRSKNVSEAMQCRAFGGRRPTMYREVRFTHLDLAAMVLMLLCIAIAAASGYARV